MLRPLFLSISLAGKCCDLEVYIYSDQLHRYFELKLTEERTGLFCTALFSFLVFFFLPLLPPFCWWKDLAVGGILCLHSLKIKSDTFL